jgi:glycosyltransferase involved in cell wall biosynthesis
MSGSEAGSEPARTLERERDRARRASEDARRADRELLRADRELLEARAEVRRLEARLRQVEGRLEALRSRRSVRAAVGISERVRAAIDAARSVVRGSGDGAATSGDVTGAIRAAPATDDGAIPGRDLPSRYRSRLLAALHDPLSSGGPVRIALAEGAEDVADAVRAGGFEVAPLRSDGRAVAAVADAILVADPALDPATLPVGPIRIGLAPASNPSFDILIDPGPSALGPTLVDAIDRWLRATRVGIRIPAGTAATADAWGDTHFARAFRDALRAAGWPTRLHFRADWEEPAIGRDDVVLDLLGLYETSAPSGAVRLLWQISHPELARPALVDRYDLVFVASDPFAELLAAEAAVPVRPLHQATDPDRFKPRPGGPSHELLFVGGWRQAGRRILEDLLPTDHGLAVYGGGWTPDQMDPRHLAGGPVPNQDLGAYYAAADIVLNDHWAGMRRDGFLSNRLYDAAAAGAFVISDDVDGIETEFDGGIVTYRDRVDLARLVDAFLADPAARRAHAERARRAVLDRHTFAHRARAFIAEVEPLLPPRGDA